MNYNVEEMRKKLLDTFDSNSGYTMDDFNKEFNGQMPLSIAEQFKFKINFKNESTNPDPEYATAGSSGFDLRANLDSQITIPPHGIKIIPTGLFFELPENFEIQIRPRSSLSAKFGVTVLNSPGTIDSDYRGEIGVILINHNNNEFIINNGDRIAQAVIASVISKNFIKLNKVVEIEINTARGTGGYGSTGIK
jgi:dUTP pyrophosphatase